VVRRLAAADCSALDVERLNAMHDLPLTIAILEHRCSQAAASTVTRFPLSDTSAELCISELPRQSFRRDEF